MLSSRLLSGLSYCKDDSLLLTYVLASISLIDSSLIVCSNISVASISEDESELDPDPSESERDSAREESVSIEDVVITLQRLLFLFYIPSA